MNINLDEYKEVKKTEYDKHKKEGDKEYAETLRFGFKYFIKKPKIFNKEEINKILTEWYWKEETCEGKPHCCIEECDLCTNCFFDLKEMFGLDRSFG